jgi:hypothetical protein
MRVVLRGWMPEPGAGSDNDAEIIGQAVVITALLGGVRSVMTGGTSSYWKVKRGGVVRADQLPALSLVCTRR